MNGSGSANGQAGRWARAAWRSEKRGQMRSRCASLAKRCSFRGRAFCSAPGQAPVLLLVAASNPKPPRMRNHNGTVGMAHNGQSALRMVMRASPRQRTRAFGHASAAMLTATGASRIRRSALTARASTARVTVVRGTGRQNPRSGHGTQPPPPPLQSSGSHHAPGPRGWEMIHRRCRRLPLAICSSSASVPLFAPDAFASVHAQPA